VSRLLSESGSVAGVGVDQELISAVPSHNPTFVERNFTEAEIAYCQAQPSPQSSFAAQWAGKEAVFKSLGVASKGAGAAMRDLAPPLVPPAPLVRSVKTKSNLTFHAPTSVPDTDQVRSHLPLKMPVLLINFRRDPLSSETRSRCSSLV
jgi:hypothetical protein